MDNHKVKQIKIREDGENIYLEIETDKWTYLWDGENYEKLNPQRNIERNLTPNNK